MDVRHQHSTNLKKKEVMEENQQMSVRIPHAENKQKTRELVEYSPAASHQALGLTLGLLQHPQKQLTKENQRIRSAGGRPADPERL